MHEADAFDVDILLVYVIPGSQTHTASARRNLLSYRNTSCR